MKGDTLFMLIFGLGMIAYVVFYIGGRQYLREYFQGSQRTVSNMNDQMAGSGSPTIAEVSPEPQPPPPNDPKLLMDYVNRPYSKDMIQSIDTYEYNMVYENESDRGLSKTLRDKLMSQYPMDWSTMPPSSSQFQAGLREYFQNQSNSALATAIGSENVNALVPSSSTASGGSTASDGSSASQKHYVAIGASQMQPRDSLADEQAERDILQTYEPQHAGSMTTYNVNDAMELIDKIYESKGEIATVYHKKDTNIYEITGVRKKDEKILYEDEEAPASNAPVRKAGEATIDVPPTAVDVAAARDPFYDPTMGGKSRIGKWDYTGWTPGLERMFAPTDPRQNWY